MGNYLMKSVSIMPFPALDSQYFYGGIQAQVLSGLLTQPQDWSFPGFVWGHSKFSLVGVSLMFPRGRVSGLGEKALG